MANAVIYARYSSHKQNDTSIDDQIRVCKAEAQRRGDTIVGIYEDHSKSGRGTKHRTEFKRMIANARHHLWSIIYVYSIDRFGRNRDDMAVFRHKLREDGVTVISATQPNIEGPESVIVESMLEGLAEYYSLILSANVKRGMEGNALRCHHNGVSLYGYDLGPDGSYIINDYEASIVREAFERYAAGESTGDIARAFARYRTRQGKEWNPQKITALLHNEKYAGTYIFGKVRVPDGMPAIVTHDLYDEVNARMGRTHQHQHDYPLSGLMYDAKGNAYFGTSGTSRNGHVYHYYMCHGSKRRYPQGFVESNVYGAVADFVSSPDVADRVVAGILDAQAEAHADDDTALEALRKRLGEIGREVSNLVRLATKMGPTDAITAQMQDLDGERSRIESELVDAEQASPRLTEDQVRFFIAKIVECEAPTDVVRVFVRRIVLDGNQMTVTFGLGCSDESSGPFPDGEHPSEPAGGEGCSRTYGLVAQAIGYTNTPSHAFWLVVGPDWFGFITRFDRSRP